MHSTRHHTRCGGHHHLSPYNTPKSSRPHRDRDRSDRDPEDTPYHKEGRRHKHRHCQGNDDDEEFGVNSAGPRGRGGNGCSHSPLSMPNDDEGSIPPPSSVILSASTCAQEGMKTHLQDGTLVISNSTIARIEKAANSFPGKAILNCAKSGHMTDELLRNFPSSSPLLLPRLTTTKR